MSGFKENQVEDNSQVKIRKKLELNRASAKKHTLLSSHYLLFQFFHLSLSWYAIYFQRISI